MKRLAPHPRASSSTGITLQHFTTKMSSPPRSRVSQNWEMRSECGPSSSSSRRSIRSNVSLAAAEARAKAEAARTRADYTRRQIEMKVERARLDAMLTAMQDEGEAEAALAAAKALEAAADTETTKDRASIGSSLVRSAEPVQRTEEFVRAHFDHHQDHPVNESAWDDPKDDPNEHSHPQNAAVEAKVLLPPRHLQGSPDCYAPPPQDAVPTPLSRTPHCTGVADRQYHDNGRSNQFPHSHSDISDLTAHLARRDLLTAGLKVFDNRPENYLSWKASFCNVTQGLNLKTE